MCRKRVEKRQRQEVESKTRHMRRCFQHKTGNPKTKTVDQESFQLKLLHVAHRDRWRCITVLKEANINSWTMSLCHETAPDNFCELSRVTRSWFLERDVAVELFRWIFLAFWASQAERRLVLFYWIKGRHLYGLILQRYSFSSHFKEPLAASRSVSIRTWSSSAVSSVWLSLHGCVCAALSVYMC